MFIYLFIIIVVIVVIIGIIVVVVLLLSLNIHSFLFVNTILETRFSTIFQFYSEKTHNIVSKNTFH